MSRDRRVCDDNFVYKEQLIFKEQGDEHPKTSEVKAECEFAIREFAPGFFYLFIRGPPSVN